MALSKCLYHFPCPDGITAALACNLFHKQKGLNLQLIPHTTYADISLDDLDLQEDQTVYLLDYAGPPGFAIKVAERVAKCVILDHHKTAAEHLTGPAASSLPPNLDVIFDQNRSGATLALDYFKPEGLSDANLAFFKHIEDGDLWRWEVPGSRAFYAGFTTAALNFDVRTNPQIFDQLLALSPSKLIETGTIELERQNKIISAAVETAYVVELGGKEGKGWGRALAVEIDDSELIRIRSQLGNSLAAEASTRGLRPMAVVVYREPGMDTTQENKVKISLRSLGETEDTTVISQYYGGGGHCNASAFLLDRNEFLSWKVD